jgi:hypothetical protein
MLVMNTVHAIVSAEFRELNVEKVFYDKEEAEEYKRYLQNKTGGLYFVKSATIN